MKTKLYLFAILVFLTVLNTQAQNFAVIGNDTNFNDETNYPSPFGNYFWGNKEQYLITASELYNAGVIPGAIGSVGFNVVNNFSTALVDFTVKVGTTSITTLSEFEQNVNTGFYSPSYTCNQGWNTFNLQNPIIWNGISNILVEVCFNNSSYTTNALVRHSPTANYSTIGNYQDNYGVCSSTNGTLYYQRPNIRIGYYNQIGNDAGIGAITSPTQSIEPGLYPISALLINYGKLPLNSAQIKYSINNGAPISTTWNSGPLSTGGSAAVNLGSYTFPQGTHLLKIWTSLPNNVLDSIGGNDTAYKLIVSMPKLNGIYSIGGVGADFPTIITAINALQAGITGPVTFKINNGTYNEQFNIGSIPGSSATNTITIESFSGNPNDVIIEYNPIFPNFTVVGFAGVKYAKIKNVTIKNTNAYANNLSSCVGITNQSTNIKVENNKLFSNLYVGYASNPIYVNGVGTDSIEISGNYIENGYTSIYFVPGEESSNTNSIIRNNTLFNFENYGIRLENQNNALIENNRIENTYIRTNGEGLSVQNCYNIGISNNTILLKSNYNSKAINFNNSGDGNSRIVNNMISIPIAAMSCQGISITYSNSTKIYHNTVHINSNSGGSAALNINSIFSIFDIRNNSFGNIGSGNAVIIDNISNIYPFDYNNYYVSNGSKIANINYFEYETLDSLKSLDTSKNSHSISFRPNFVSDENLHTSNYELYQKGANVGVATDVDNQARNISTPTIGADEFTLYSNDIGVIDITEPHHPCVGTSNFVVKVKNFGTNTINSLKVNWTVNGVLQTATTYTTPIAPGTTANVSIGNYTLQANVVYDLAIYTYLPNNAVDPNTSNDTFNIDNGMASMSGSYTVGAGGDFPTIKSAANALNDRGICSAVTINILPGIYTEQFVVGDISGVSSTNTVTFKSSTNNPADVTIQYSYTNNYGYYTSDSNYIVQVFHTQNIIFKNLTFFIQQPNYQSSVVKIIGANNLEFSGNVFNSAEWGINNETYAIATTQNMTADSIRIIGNTFSNFAKPINVNSDYFKRAFGIQISNNFFNRFKKAINLQYSDSTSIENNYFSTNFDGNDIGAIATYNSNNIKISKNKININSNAYTKAIEVNSASQVNYSKSIIVNNFIHINSGYTVNGIVVNFSDHVDVFYNTVHLSNAGSNSSAFTYDGSVFANQYINVLNNVFVNYGQGFAVNLYNQDCINTMNFNDYYAASGPLAQVYGSNYWDLQSWKSSYQTHNTNAYNLNPYFVSNGNAKFVNPNLNNVGTPLAGFSYDTQDSSRNVMTPDIGAMEFTPALHDLKAEKILTPIDGEIIDLNVYVPLEVRIINLGLSSESNFPIKIKVNDTATYIYNFAGSLLPGRDTVVTFSQSLYFTNLSYIKLVAFTDLASDLDRLNDTTFNYYSACGPLSGTYQVGNAASVFKTISGAIAAIQNCGMNGPVTLNLLPGTYTELVDIENLTEVTAQSPLKIRAANGDSSSVIIVQNVAANSEMPVVIAFGNVEYVTIENITIQNNIPNSSAAIVAFGNSNNININNCIISSPNNQGENYGIVMVNNEGNKNGGGETAKVVTPEMNYYMVSNNFHINNCKITGASYGIFGRDFNPIMSSNDFQVNNCTIQNFDSSGIDLTGFMNLKIQNNKITSSKTQKIYGVRLDNIYFEPLIHSNKIFAEGGNGTSAFLLLNSTGSQDRIEYEPSNNFAKIFNNFFSAKSTSGSCSAVALDSCINIDFIYNSLYSNSTANGAAMYLNKISNLNVKNNSLYGSNKSIALYANNINSATSNYNNFKSASDTIGNFDGVFVTSLSALRTITQADANSISVNPSYFSQSDLHSNSPLLNATGTPIASFLLDIDGQMRNSTTPDIGADEFNPQFPLDLTVTDLFSAKHCTGTDSLFAKIKNNGTSTVTNFKVRWYDGTGFTALKSFTKTILPDSFVVVNLVANHPVGLIQMNASAVCLEPNSVVDQNLANDSLFKVLNFFPASPLFISGLDTAYCIKNQSNTIFASPAGGTFSGPGITTNQFNSQNAGVGTHTIFYTLTNVYGCLSKDSIITKVKASPTVTFGSIAPVCDSLNIVQINTGLPVGGVYSGNGITQSGAFNPHLSGIGSTVLTYTYTNSVGCSASANSTVMVNAQPTSSFNLASTICNNDTLLVTYTGDGGVGATYSWNFDNGTINSGSGMGPYKVTFATAGVKYINLYVQKNGCGSSLTTKLVFVNPVAATVFATNGGSFCSGDSLLIVGNQAAGNSYKWYKDATLLPNDTLGYYYAKASGSYQLKVLNANGCSAISSPVAIVQKPMPTSTFTIVPTACSTDTLNVTYTGSASVGATYNWNFNGGNVISGSGQGPYSIRYSNGGVKTPSLSVTQNGCTSTSNVMSTLIHEVNSSIYVTGDSSFCQDDSLLLTGSSLPGASYQWYQNDTIINGATNTYYFASNSGIYSMKTSNSFGCSSISNPIVLNEKLKPSSAFTIPSEACLENTLNAVYTGNAPANANYIWSHSGANIVSGSNQGPLEFKYTTTGQKVVSLKVNLNGCVSEITSHSLVVNSTTANATVVGATTFCFGDSVTLFGNTGPNLEYQWLNANSELLGETNSYITAKNSGSYKVKVTNNLTSCSAISNAISVTVNSSDFNLAFTANQTNFTTPPFNAVFNNTTPSASNYSFVWTFGDGTTSQSINPTHQYIWDGNYTVGLFAQNILTGCTDTIIKTNYIHTFGGTPNPCLISATINQGGSTVICQGDSLLLNANVTGAQGNVAYTWFRNGVYLAQYTSQSFYAKQNGNYVVVVEDTVCNFTSGPLVVGYFPSVTPIINSFDTIQPCSNDSMQLFVTNYFNAYLWSTGQTSSSIYVKQSGNYYVTVTNANGCNLVSNAYIVNASLLQPPSICIVGVDTANHNQVIWERPNTTLIDTFYIYRETTVANIYQKIGAVSYTNPGIFVDNQANPATRAWRYRLTAKDTCGMESPLSSIHKTMHLTINVGLNGSWNLIWDGYQGFNFGSYNIYRGSSPTTMNILTQVPSNISSYTDLNPPTGTVYYQLEIVNPYGCYPDSTFAKVNTNYNSSRSNTANTGSLIPQFLSADFAADQTQGIWPVQIQFSDLSSGGPNNWKWNFGDGNISIEENPKHVYNNTGLYTVRLISCYNNVCDTMEKVNYINVLPNGMVEIYKNVQMAVFPNPASDRITVQLENQIAADYQLSIFDAYGQRLKSENISSPAGENNYVLDVANFAEGVYFIILQNTDVRIVRKVIIK